MPTAKPVANSAISVKARKVLSFADDLAALIQYRDDLSNAFFAPNGIVAGTFPDMADRRKFFRTKECKKLWAIIRSKESRPPTEKVWFPPLEFRVKKSRPGVKSA